MADNRSLNPISLLTIILIEGFITISVEILTIRQLIPKVGNSVIVTSLIIGVFLLFLALGYQKGGTYRKNYTAILKRNFIISTAILGVGLSYAFITLLFHMVEYHLHTNAMVPLTIYLLLITSPLVYLLGQTVPITTNLFKETAHIGTISGRVLSLSTLGSFLGSVLTSLLLMNYFGVAWTVFINYALLAGLTLLLCNKFSRHIITITALIVIGMISYYLNISIEQAFFIKTNAYNNYQIEQTKRGKMLILNDSSSSLLTPENKGFDYLELIKKILFQDLKITDKTILVLGAGGFTLSAENTYGNHFIYNDIDPGIKRVVTKHYLNPIKGSFIHKDARNFLNNSKQRFDVIVSDTFSNRTSIPFHLVTKEYFTTLKNHLTENGIVLMNIIANPMYTDNYSKRIDNTIRTVFNHCIATPTHYVTANSNIVYMCSKGESTADRMIYTDNKNQATLDYMLKGK